MPVCVTLGDAEADADAEELAELPFERVAVAEGEAGSVGVQGPARVAHAYAHGRRVGRDRLPILL